NVVISLVRELAAATLLPELGEQEFQQRQAARLRPDFVEHAVDKPIFESKSNLFGRLFDGAAKLFGCHRANVDHRILQSIGKIAIAQHMPIKVRPQGQYDGALPGCSRIKKLFDKTRPEPLIMAQRIELLPLVDDQEEAIRPGLPLKYSLHY